MVGLTSLDQFLTPEVFLVMLNSTNASGLNLMENILHQGCTTHILNTVLTKTALKDLIRSIVNSIQKLTANRLDISVQQIAERLTAMQVMKVLGFKLKYTSSLNLGIPLEIQTTLLHYVIHKGQIGIIQELFSQLNRDEHLELLSTTDNQYEMNALGWAIMAGKIEAISYLRELIGQEQTYRLARFKGNSGCTALHLASLCQMPLDQICMSLRIDDIIELLSTQDNEGQSVLALSISDDDQEAFHSIMRYFMSNPVDLIKLSKVVTNESGSSFRLAAMNKDQDYLLKLIMACYTVSTIYEVKTAVQEALEELLEVEHSIPKDNIDLLKWSLEQAQRGCYQLVEQPSVLVISMVRHREGAQHEANSILKAFKTIGFQVTYKTDLKENQIHHEIRKAQSSKFGKNGQIVVIMGHGSQGHICDVDLRQIALGQLERTMAPQSLAGTPKILIVQACQNAPVPDPEPLNRTSNTSLESPTLEESSYDPFPSGLVVHRPYTPTMKDFFTMISSVTGSRSERDVFIPLIAEAIVSSYPNDDIHKVFTEAHCKMSKIRNQIPVVGSTMRGLLCLRNVWRQPPIETE